MKILFLIYPFCSIFIFVGGAMSYVTLARILKARTVAHWPTAAATIVECELETSSGRDTREVSVKYRYRVAGEDYEASGIHPLYSGSSFEGHLPLYERLKQSSVVNAHYNEVDPGEAYLLSGNFSAHWAMFFGGMIFFSAGLFFLLTLHFAVAGNSDYAGALSVVK